MKISNKNKCPSQVVSLKIVSCPYCVCMFRRFRRPVQSMVVARARATQVQEASHHINGLEPEAAARGRGKGAHL